MPTTPFNQGEEKTNAKKGDEKLKCGHTKADHLRMGEELLEGLLGLSDEERTETETHEVEVGSKEEAINALVQDLPFEQAVKIASEVLGRAVDANNGVGMRIEGIRSRDNSKVVITVTSEEL